LQVLQAAKDLGGLDVVATICDMGTTNVKALKSMGSSTECPYFEGKDIFTLFDPPHLFEVHSCFISQARDIVCKCEE
jgi:hypothetical protein